MVLQTEIYRIFLTLFNTILFLWGGGEINLLFDLTVLRHTPSDTKIKFYYGLFPFL
jgi:hypothetical protein